MDVNQILAELEALGTAQNRKVYARHGVAEPLYGVSFANLGKLARRIKTDHDLAEALWATGNHDARVLAAMVGDGARMGEDDLERWADALGNYVLTDAFSALAGRTADVRRLIEVWGRSDHEWRGQAAFNLLTGLAMREAGPDEADEADEADEVDDAYFEGYLATIEAEIHQRKNRVRYAMNNALIAIGGRNQRLRASAVAAANRIGRVEVDHGETNCKTSDAVPYIERMWAHKAEKAKKKAKRQAKKKARH